MSEPPLTQFHCSLRDVVSVPHPACTLFALFLIQTVSGCLGQVGLQRVVFQIQPLKALKAETQQRNLFK